MVLPAKHRDAMLRRHYHFSAGLLIVPQRMGMVYTACDHSYGVNYCIFAGTDGRGRAARDWST